MVNHGVGIWGIRLQFLQGISKYLAESKHIKKLKLTDHMRNDQPCSKLLL